MGHQFMFATGIENSYPTIRLPDGSEKRVDELEKTDFYNRWREDFGLVKDLRIEYLRYGSPYYKTHLAPDKYDWDFSDETFAELKKLGIVPIADLCHFGVPDWIGNFQNPDFPELFAAYARAFAERFPWVRFYTPVNEMYIAATFSGQLGWWNERLSSDRAFVTALKHIARANIRAEEEIHKVQPAALFIQSESTEYFHPGHPKAQERADFFNEKRFLSLDLCYGRDVSAKMFRYLTENGMTSDEYDWFMRRGAHAKQHCIMGNDYYWTNEHLVPPDEGNITPSGEIFGYYVITKQYFERYHLPVMHTETNFADVEKAPGWLWKEWANMMRLKNDGVPIIGFTWYSLIDQIDWDTVLREDNGNVNPLGLYDIDRKIRPVGAAYKKLVEQWRQILPTESLCLMNHTLESVQEGVGNFRDGEHSGF